MAAVGPMEALIILRDPRPSGWSRSADRARDPVAAFATTPAGGVRRPSRTRQSSSCCQRYARGEIDATALEERKRTLGG